MKSLALITQVKDSDVAQWQFDRVMSAIAYDLDLTVVFMPSGFTQLANKAWRCLEIYGIENTYILIEDQLNIQDALFNVKGIDYFQLQKLISESDLII